MALGKIIWFIAAMLLAQRMVAAEVCEDCASLAGNWTGSENVTITIFYRGTVQTDTRNGAGTFPIIQNGCRFSFTNLTADPTTGQPVPVPRSGTLTGNSLRFTGLAALPIPRATMYENRVVGIGTVSKNTLKFQSTGRITGRLDGSDFLITTTSRATFTGTRSWCEPAITADPTNQTAVAGWPVSFRPQVEGLNLSYQWRYGGTNIPRATNLVYTIPSVKASQAGQYSVVVKNFDGSVTSGPALLSIVDSPFVGAQGTYNGLFYEPEVANHESSGFLRLTVTDKGLYTGRLISGGVTNNFTGNFSLEGTAVRTFSHPGKTLTLALVLDLEAGGFSHGSVTDGVWTAPLSMVKAILDPVGQPAFYRGRYTVAFPPDAFNPNGPDGTGAAAVQADATGKVTITGRLGDGQPISVSSMASSNGEWPFYTTLYRGQGSAFGWFTFAGGEDITSDFVRWMRVGSFTNIVEPLGSSYVWLRTNRVLNTTNALMIFSGDGLAQAVSNRVVLTSNNRLTTSSPMKATINTTNGIFTGSFRVPGTRRTNQFQGAIIQDLNIGVGQFLGPQQSGHVLLQPTDAP